MTLRPRHALPAAFLLFAAAAAACTGEDPVAAVASSPDAGSDASTPPVDAATVEEDAKTPVCVEPLADCNGDGTCDTSLDTDPKNCGKCARDCGGASCVGRKCQPQTVMDKLTGAVSLAVNTSALVVLATGGPRVCAKTGCGGVSPVGLANGESIANGPHTLYVDDTNAYWLGLPGAGSQWELRRCAVAGCGLAPQVIDDGQLGTELRGEGNLALRYDPTGLITKITLAATVTKAYLSTATLPYSQHFALSGGKMAFSNNDGATGGTRGVWYGDFANVAPTRLMNIGDFVALQDGVVYASRTADATYDAIYACPIAGCGGIGTPLGGTGPTNGTGKIVDMTSDASGLYWIERQGTVGRVMRCALPGCPSGPEVLAPSQDAPVAITTDASFVYWVNAGTGGGNGTVARIAK